MTIKEFLSRGVIQLKSNNIDNPVLKARLLLQYTLGKKREYLIVYDSKEITKEQEEKYMKNIKKVISGIPVQHITRSTRIYENEFFCKSRCLNSKT